MSLTIPAYMWTLIGGLLRRSAASLPACGSWACERCGYAIEGHVEDGTSLFILTVDCFPAKQSRYRHVLALTPDGKLSILCGSLQFAEHRSRIDSGASDGTSYTEKSSDHENTDTPKAK